MLMAEQLEFLDFLNIASFCIGLMNLEENLTQGDKQELMEELSRKTDILLQEIHAHLEVQDNKLDYIMEVLKDEKDGKSDKRNP